MDARVAVHPGGAGTLVAPHPIPRDQKERGIGDEIEQIIEPAMRIITGPTVQLGLDLPYPALRPKQGELQFVGVHRRQPPDLPVSSTADLLAPFAMYAASRCSDYYEASAPPDGHQSATDLPAAGPAARRGGRPRMVPTFTTKSIEE